MIRVPPAAPRITILRRAIKLTQAGFAKKFKIPIGTLRDWQQERAKPDAAARTYLQLITIAPDAVLAILAKAPRRNGRSPVLNALITR